MMVSNVIVYRAAKRVSMLASSAEKDKEVRDTPVTFSLHRTGNRCTV